MMITANPELAIEVDAIAGILRNTPMNGVASYEEMTAAVGYNVQARRFALLKAQKKVEEETGLRFGTVHGLGVKLLDSEAVVGIGKAVRRTIAKKAKKQAARLTGLRYNNIDRATQAQIDAERSLLGAISATARADPEKLVEQTQTGPIVATRVFDALGRI